MTISSTSNKAQFSGSGTTGPFPFTFKVFDSGDLDIIKTSSVGVDTTLTITTHYSVSLNSDQNNDPGGDVTLVSSLAVGETLTILRTVDATQETDIANGGGFYPEVIENALDRVTMLCQQNAEVVSRAIVAGVAAGSTTPQELIDSINAAAAATAADAAATAADAAATAADVSTIGGVNGLVKGDGAGGISAATAGTDYAKPATASTWTAPQRGTLTTDNDLSFDLSATNYFSCTPSAGGTLTFTNIPSGQPVAIKLVNGSNYAIAAAATTKISTADLTRISATGTYLITGLSDGTNVYLQASANIA